MMFFLFSAFCSVLVQKRGPGKRVNVIDQTIILFSDCMHKCKYDIEKRH